MLQSVANAGASAVLVGESLMRSGDVRNNPFIASLQVPREVITMTKVKICGLMEGTCASGG